MVQFFRIESVLHLHLHLIQKIAVEHISHDLKEAFCTVCAHTFFEHTHAHTQTVFKHKGNGNGNAYIDVCIICDHFKNHAHKMRWFPISYEQ